MSEVGGQKPEDPSEIVAIGEFHGASRGQSSAGSGQLAAGSILDLGLRIADLGRHRA